MALTDTAIRNAKPGDKAQKLYDEGGLFLLLNPNGAKWWRFKYRLEGKEKLLSFGTYPEVSLKEAREKREQAAFYRKSGFGESIGARPLTVRVYTGCLLVPMPNIETRRRYLKYHDLHHLLTGYSVGRIGEGEVSAWELGTGSVFASPVLGFMNLIALSTGLVLEPGRMWRAFRRGWVCRNLYSAKTRREIEAGNWPTLEALAQHALNAKRGSVPAFVRGVEFGCYALTALVIHASIAIPAVILRIITDIGLGYSVFQAVKPTKRSDLY